MNDIKLETKNGGWWPSPPPLLPTLSFTQKRNFKTCAKKDELTSWAKQLEISVASELTDSASAPKESDAKTGTAGADSSEVPTNNEHFSGRMLKM